METEYALKSIINTLSFIEKLEKLLKYLDLQKNKSPNSSDIELPF
jgi:hypothetical protein